MAGRWEPMSIFVCLYAFKVPAVETVSKFVEEIVVVGGTWGIKLRARPSQPREHATV